MKPKTIKSHKGMAERQVLMKVRSEYLKKAIEDFIVEVAEIKGVPAEKFGRKIWRKIERLHDRVDLNNYLNDVYSEAICPTKIKYEDVLA